MRKITPKHYAVLLAELTEDLSHQEIERVVKKFVLLLVGRNQLSLAEKIVYEFHHHYLKIAGQREGELTSARPLPEREKKEIERALAGLLKQEVILRDKIDRTLLGGVLIRFPDLLIDASLKGRLQSLKQSLISAS